MSSVWNCQRHIFPHWWRFLWNQSWAGISLQFSEEEKGAWFKSFRGWSFYRCVNLFVKHFTWSVVGSNSWRHRSFTCCARLKSDDNVCSDYLSWLFTAWSHLGASVCFCLSYLKQSCLWTFVVKMKRGIECVVLSFMNSQELCQYRHKYV